MDVIFLLFRSPNLIALQQAPQILFNKYKTAINRYMSINKLSSRSIDDVRTVVWVFFGIFKNFEYLRMTYRTE